MTVEKLIKLLQTLPASTLVVLSKDAEGNRYSPLEKLEPGYYQHKSSWLGEFRPAPIAPSLEPDTVCLFPINQGVSR